MGSPYFRGLLGTEKESPETKKTSRGEVLRSLNLRLEIKRVGNPTIDKGRRRWRDYEVTRERPKSQ